MDMSGEEEKFTLPQISFLRIQRSKKMQAKPLIDRVYWWASMWVSENMEYKLGSHYYWTDPVKRLLYKLEHIKGGFIGLVGLQGAGKTTALFELYCKLRGERPKHVFFRSWKDTTYAWFMYEYESGGRRFQRMFDEPEGFGSEPKTLFIDMGDYSKSGRGSMNRHLTQIRTLWLETRRYNLTIIVSIQKEMYHSHFLFGKIDAIELEPLKPVQLVEAYKRFWKTSEPFTDNALLLLAQLSRGIFRRFMKYIQTCIEKHQLTASKGFINVKAVNQTVTFDQIARDMDLELSDIFRRSEQKLEAVKLLDYLRQNTEANQKQIAEGIGVSESTVTRLMRKMEAHRYVTRKRDKHGQWLTRLRF